MPYIKPEDRGRWCKWLAGLDLEMLSGGCCPGDLNYVITSIIHSYIEFRGKSYTSLNDVVGVLDAAKLEFYRRVVAPYEDLKIQKNGDV